jgi:hypothetical protein
MKVTHVYGPLVVLHVRGVETLHARRMQRHALAPTRQEGQHHRVSTHVRRPQHTDGAAVERVGPQLARHMHGHQRGPVPRAGETGPARGAHAVIACQLPGALAVRAIITSPVRVSSLGVRQRPAVAVSSAVLISPGAGDICTRARREGASTASTSVDSRHNHETRGMMVTGAAPGTRCIPGTESTGGTTSPIA